MLCPQLPCLLPAGLVDSEITQTPKYLVKSRKQQVTLRCSPDSGHLSLYWYYRPWARAPSSLFSISTECERINKSIRMMLRSTVQ